MFLVAINITISIKSNSSLILQAQIADYGHGLIQYSLEWNLLYANIQSFGGLVEIICLHNHVVLNFR